MDGTDQEWSPLVLLRFQATFRLLCNKMKSSQINIFPKINVFGGPYTAGSHLSWHERMRWEQCEQSSKNG